MTCLNPADVEDNGLLLGTDTFSSVLEYKLLCLIQSDGFDVKGAGRQLLLSAKDVRPIVSEAFDFCQAKALSTSGLSDGPVAQSLYWFVNSVCELALWRSMRDLGIGDICHIDARYWALKRRADLSPDCLIQQLEKLLELLRRSIQNFDAEKCETSYEHAAALAADLTNRISTIFPLGSLEPLTNNGQAAEEALDQVCDALTGNRLVGVNFDWNSGGFFINLDEYLSLPLRKKRGRRPDHHRSSGFNRSPLPRKRPRVCFAGNPEECLRADTAMLRDACEKARIAACLPQQLVKIPRSFNDSARLIALFNEVEESFRTFKRCVYEVDETDMFGSFAKQVKCGGSSFRYYDIETGAYEARPHTICPSFGIDPDFDEETIPFELEYRSPEFFADEASQNPEWLAEDCFDKPDWLCGFYSRSTQMFENSCSGGALEFLRATNSEVYRRFSANDPIRGIDAFWCGLALIALEADRRLGVCNLQWGQFRSQMVHLVQRTVAPLVSEMSTEQEEASAKALDDLLESMTEELTS